MRIDPQPDLLTSRFSPDGHGEQSPTADPSAIVQGAQYRFTVLSSRLIRLEWSASGDFVDHATSVVVNRRFDVPPFELEENDELLVIRTEHLLLRYDKGPFTAGGLSIALRQKAQSSHFSTWHCGDPLPHPGGEAGNLGGTARTLDDVDGACELSPGILATYGFAVVDDSTSVELGEDGWITPRPPGGTDLYFFGHGRDFRAALAEFFRLTGPVPLVPRRALGNWWSRFWAYTDTEYLDLMDRFAADGAPFSVAVLDMDWHVVDIDPQLGSGWTGYSWNRQLFPDPPGFLHDLHQRSMLVCLNVHPADGVRRHEVAYPAMAADLGIDPDSGVEIPFDITSPLFVDSYLKRLHHPHEKDGVDFWWLDWQSGGSTRVPVWTPYGCSTTSTSTTPPERGGDRSRCPGMPGWAATAIRSDSPATRSRPGTPSISSRTSLRRPPTSATSGGATTSVGTCSVSRTMSSRCAGSNSAPSRRSTACTRPTTRSTRRSHRNSGRKLRPF